MALTFTTGMTLADPAEPNASDLTNSIWAAYRFSGSGQAPNAALRTDVFKEGTVSISAKCIGNNWDSGLIYDYYTDNSNATLNLTTTGNEVLAIWAKVDTVGKMLTFSAEGMYIIVQSSAETGTTAPTVYSKWVVSGSDVYPGGWVLFMIDTRKTPTTTVGGGADLTAVRRIGMGNKNVSSVGTILTDNFFLDAIWYGRPNYKVVGDGTLVADWDDFLTHSKDTQQNGLITSVGGVLLASCGIQFGDASQSATTTFADATGKILSFRRHTYYNAGVVDALNYADYYIVQAAGAAAQRTSVTFGAVVGSGDTRQGVLGGSLQSEDTANITWKIDFKTDKADLSAVKLYGLSVVGAKGGIALDNNSGGTETELISCQFLNCGEIDSGTTGGGAAVLNSFVIDPLGDTNNYGLLFPQTPSGGTLAHNCKNVNFVTTGVPATQYMTRFTYTGDYSVTFDGLKFFGNYTSGTLWHGLNSGTNADVTILKTGGADPVGTEYSNTNGGTVTPTATFVFTMTNIPENTQVTVVNSSTRAELQNSTATATGTVTYSHSGGETVDVLFMINTHDPNVSDIYDLTLPSADSSAKIQMIDDLNYENP